MTPKMPTLYTQKNKNIRKTWFLITAFLVFIIGLGYVFSYQFNSQGVGLLETEKIYMGKNYLGFLKIIKPLN